MRSAFLRGRSPLLALAAVVAVMLAGADQASAAIIYSGDINIPVPIGAAGSGIGLYIDFETMTASPESIVGWDIRLNGNNTGFLTVTSFTTSNNHFISYDGFPPRVARIAVGFEVGPSGPYQSLGGGTMHGSAGSYPFLFNSENLCGFRHVTPGGQTQYGWLNLELGSDFLTRSLRGFAIEDSGASITAGAVPEPASAALLALSALIGLRRR